MSDSNNSSPFGSSTGSTGSTPSQDGGSGVSGMSSSEEAPQRGSDFLNRRRENAAVQLSTQKSSAKSGLGTVAQAVRQKTERLREQKYEAIAGYVEQAADEIDKLSERLRGDLTELLSDVQRLARQKPAVFIGGAFALGVMSARFLKSTRERQQQSDRGNPGQAAAREPRGTR
jgi:hypothetical protein